MQCEKLDFEADHLETISLPKVQPSSTKDVFKEGDVLADNAAAGVEEGEIEDSSGVESCDDTQQRCRFFEKGLCAFGEKCRFLHRSDKGLYTMFDCPRFPSRRVVSRPAITRELKTDITFPAVSTEEDVADWDRELEEAILRVGFSKKKVPLDERGLTIRTTSVDESTFPTSPVLENNTSSRRVRYRGEDESGSVASKRNKTRSRETARLERSPNSSRYVKRRYSDTSHSRSRSSGRRFSCKCCRTPSPKLRRYRSSRRPICCYRRMSISSSSSSSPVSRRRVVMRRVRDVVNGTRRKHRRRSRTSSPDKTKSRQYMRGCKVSDTHVLGKESHTNKRRNSKSLASSPKASLMKNNSHKKSLSSTSPPSCKYDNYATSYSPDRRLCDMSISPYSSDSFTHSEGEPGKLSSSVRHADVISILPISNSSPDRFPESSCRADKLSNVAEMVSSPVPRKVSKSGSAHEKRLKNDVAELEPLYEPRKIQKSQHSAPKKVFVDDLTELNTSAVPKSADFDSKGKSEKDNTESKSLAIPRKISKSDNSIPKKQYNGLMFDLMKFHKKGNSTKVATKTAHPVKEKETPVTNVLQISATSRSATLSKKELLLKQLQEVTAAIERKKKRN